MQLLKKHYMSKLTRILFDNNIAGNRAKETKSSFNARKGISYVRAKICIVRYYSPQHICIPYQIYLVEYLLTCKIKYKINI